MFNNSKNDWASAWDSSKAISYWLPAIGGACGLWRGAAEAARRKQEEEEKAQQMRDAEERARAADERRRRSEQQEYRNQIIALGQQSIGLFESLPKHLSAAEKCLDRAEVDFAEDAFAPFWDSIENAANCLGRFDECVQQLKSNSSRYTELIGKCEDAPPHFPLTGNSVRKLNVGTATAERMGPIVRTAQRNFQFATIYEQRKTNLVLVAGFTNLARALNRMTSQITESIDALAGSVELMSSTQDAIYSRMVMLWNRPASIMTT
jgi:uncharacterized protein YfcZ (UPF0381/DUF406 family)